MKQVFFVIDSLCCGGAEKSLVSLLSMLDYSRIQVDLMLVKRDGCFERFLPKEVQIVPFLQPPSLLFRIAQLYFSILLRLLRKRHGAEVRWIAMKGVYEYMSKRYDVAVAYQQGFPTYFIAEKVKANRKIAWINTDLEKAGYRSGFNRPFYDKMDFVCCVSDVLYALTSDSGYVDRDKLIIIKDILDPGLIRTAANEPIPIEISQRKIQLLTVGRLAAPKNYLLAVNAAKVLYDHGLDFVWVFVGEGSERKKVEALVETYGLQERIILAGLQDNPYPFYKQCDIYVQTSSFEGFGLTLSEAKILHKSIVTTNFPSAYDQIIDGENGLIAEMTPESVADKILRIVENPTLKNRLIENTRKEENRTAETESERVNRLLLED